VSGTFAIDLSQVTRLAEDLEHAPARCVAAVTPVIKRGAYNIKRDAFWRIQAVVSGGAGYARQYPYSITYDVHVAPTRVAAEIGPDKDKPQGALGNLLEYGSANNPPYPHLTPAFNTEVKRAEVALSRAALKAILG
jgi:hypothetical protein